MLFQSPLSWELLALPVSLVIVSYLVGSVSPAYVVVRQRLGRDIRQLGDGNAGAENVSRLVGIRPAVLVAAIDISKGLLVVLVTRWLSSPASMEHSAAGGLSGDGFRNVVVLSAGMAAVLGHSWSVYLKGAGGRGAATAVGVLCGIYPARAAGSPSCIRAVAPPSQHHLGAVHILCRNGSVNCINGVLESLRLLSVLGYVRTCPAGYGGDNSLCQSQKNRAACLGPAREMKNRTTLCPGSTRADVAAIGAWCTHLGFNEIDGRRTSQLAGQAPRVIA